MDLHCCKPYLVLRSLLSALHNCIASTGIEAMCVAKMIAQSTLKLHTLPNGWVQWDTMIGLCN